jgi:hypothetical protein
MDDDSPENDAEQIALRIPAGELVDGQRVVASTGYDAYRFLRILA